MKGLRKQIEADKQSSPPTAEAVMTEEKDNPRKSLSFVGGYFSPAFARAIKAMTAQEGITIQALVREALTDACRKRGVQLPND